jgi:hypothetical protein
MKKRLIIAVLGIPATLVIALTTDIVSVPFDYLRGSFSRPEIGAELHVSVPQNYPSIRGLVVTRTVSGTNVEILGK